jgi:hypothetical protein
VESFSKKPTIREFNHKNKYNDWQFIYDPAADRGGLITTPNQPPLQGGLGFGTPAGQNGQPGSPAGSSPFGQSSSGQSSFGGFGQSSGFGNSSGPGGVGSSTQQPPPSSSPQPQ